MSHGSTVSLFVSLSKDTLTQKLFKKNCEDFGSYLFQVLGSPPLRSELATSEGEFIEATPEPQKAMSEAVSY